MLILLSSSFVLSVASSTVYVSSHDQLLMFLGCSSVAPALRSSSEGPVTSPCSSFKKCKSTWIFSSVVSECECLHDTYYIVNKIQMKESDNPSKHISPQWHAKSLSRQYAVLQTSDMPTCNIITSVSHGEAFRAAA